MTNHIASHIITKGMLQSFPLYHGWIVNDIEIVIVKRGGGGDSAPRAIPVIGDAESLDGLHATRWAWKEGKPFPIKPEDLQDINNDDIITLTIRPKIIDENIDITATRIKNDISARLISMQPEINESNISIKVEPIERIEEDDED